MKGQERDSKQAEKAEQSVAPEEFGPIGRYTNFMRVVHTRDEFTLDFGVREPGTKYVGLHSRMVSSPTHAKRMVKALQENVRKYEERFGEVSAEELPADDPGKSSGRR